MFKPFPMPFAYGGSALACALLLASSHPAQAQTGPLPAPVVPGNPAPAVALAPVANTPYAIGAQRSGATKCIGRVNQVTGFLTANSTNSGVVFNAPGVEANQKLLSTVLETQGTAPGSPTSFTSASFAPGVGAADCSATYDAVTYWPTPCQQVANTNFAAFKVSQPLNKTIFTLDGGPLVKVYLMPAGPTGCVSIKKEVLY